MAARIFTEWNTPIDGGPETDMERHEQYAAFVAQAMASTMPWLWVLLNEGNARVIAGTGMFSVELPEAPNEWHDVPEMAARLNLLPWAEPEETGH